MISCFQADQKLGQFGLVSAIQLDEECQPSGCHSIPANAGGHSADDLRGDERSDEQGDAEAGNSVVKMIII
jgi:hypothetical protein